MRRVSKLQVKFCRQEYSHKMWSCRFYLSVYSRKYKSGMDIAFIKNKCQFSLNIYVGILLFPFISPFISGRLIRCSMYLLNVCMRNISLLTEMQLLLV